MKYSVNDLCPCGSGKKYKKCCQIYHKGATPEKALFVMKARYSAYATGNVAYIIATTHPDHPDSKKDLTERKKEIEHFIHNTVFKKLEILKEEPGDPFSYVTFRVFLEQGGKPLTFTERSTFEKREGRWLYLSCEVT